jgi:hypothetical protein
MFADFIAIDPYTLGMGSNTNRCGFNNVRPHTGE